jgi:hypothetical protein
LREIHIAVRDNTHKIANVCKDKWDKISHLHNSIELPPINDLSDPLLPEEQQI